MEVHGLDVHLRVFNSFLFFILFGHGLDTNRALVDTDDLLVTLFEHFLGQSGVTSSNIENFVLFIDIGGDDVLDSAESLVPVEGF